MRWSICVSMLLLLSAPSLHAGDGRVEINQACAVNTGCFSGDAAGFPVTIDGSAGESYLLTGSLQVPDENTTAIDITSAADRISIDLGIFS